MANATYGIFVRDLASYQPFLTTLAASEDQLEKQRDMEAECLAGNTRLIRGSKRNDALVNKFFDVKPAVIIDGGATKDVRYGPKADSFTATKKPLVDYLVCE